AEESDISTLLRLERQCWPAGTRANAEVLRARLARFPLGQLVLEHDRVVVGVIYSQRVVTGEGVGTGPIEVQGSHSEDGRIIQILGLNIAPKMQDRSYGGQLLEFMLQLCTVMEGVSTVIGVTRCKDRRRHPHISMEEYIQLRNNGGQLVDTVLRLHEMHGARVRQVVPGYRPRDRE